ncbi:hypothetical protein [Alicyclobacillus sp. SO9]|uniref:hypothetical protein n=1 Tax=Alicyclobacillus sp. SO9 TaxID=2665646 RepID=UPI0018E87C30|nr:hypothetical protein [Alicyclobacillus sp. SO9]QQE76831.1 hypothetical protein GI364_12480 [Alicyclobacillus sp. SO9]
MLNKPRTMFSKAIDMVDVWLIPVTFAALCVLVMAQFATSIPAVRQRVDQMEGRFVVYSSASAFSASAKRTAYIQLYLAPQSAQGLNIQVMENGHQVGTLSQGSVRVPVHNGSKLELIAHGLTQTVHITVDHNNPALLRPAPGRTVVLSPQQQQAALPNARFIP